MKKCHLLFLIVLTATLGLSWPFSELVSTSNPQTYGSHAWLQREVQIFGSETNINNNVLRLGLIAYLNAQKRGVIDKPYLTVIDYSKPSNEKRLWVFDVQTGRTLFDTWVAHGKNSGGLVPTSFSNRPGSLKSSLGVFVTEQPYIGKNGYSLHLKGLEQGINNNAYRRAVVIHGAWYVSANTIHQYGEAGRSWGCPAVSENLAEPLINTIKGNSLVFAYYPDQNWLSHSRYLA